jgi:hypothetical protein
VLASMSKVFSVSAEVFAFIRVRRKEFLLPGGSGGPPYLGSVWSTEESHSSTEGHFFFGATQSIPAKVT